MKVRRKLILSILGLGVSAITLTGTTFAWFRMSSQAYVSKLDYTVVSGKGFQIAVDGSNTAFYSDFLDTYHMEMAIVNGLDPDRYVFRDNNLYLQTINEETNEKIIDNNPLTQKELESIIEKGISLDLTTSLDGENINNRNDELIDPRSGKYVEFNLYFKTRSKKGGDQQHYKIYLTDDDTYTNEDSGQTFKMNPTKFKSEVQTVKLYNKVELWDLETNSKKTLKAGDTLDIDIANAIRLSIQDTGKIDVSDEAVDENNPKLSNLEVVDDVDGIKDEATIYELTNDLDLGSYATDYDGSDELLRQKYDYQYNPMYTYYKSLGASREFEPLKYSEISKLYEENKIINDLSKKITFTEVESGLTGRKVTFRIWLEGFDADYFTGVSYSLSNISCNLAFKYDKED